MTKGWKFWVLRVGPWGLVAGVFLGRWWVGNECLMVSVGVETTRIVGPLRGDGGVDYIGAINERYGKGVAPGENAAVALVGILGQRSFLGEGSETLSREMGVGAESGTFLPWVTYVRERYGVEEDSAESRTWRRMLDEARDRVWVGAEVPAVLRWLEANAGALRRVERASRMTKYFVPMWSRKNPSELYETNVENLGAVRELGDALLARCMLQVEHGDADGAWADSMTVERLGMLVMQGPTMTQRHFGAALVQRACAGQGVILTTLLVNGTQARRMREELAGLGPLPALEEAVDGEQRYESLDLVQRTAMYGWEVDERAAGTAPVRAGTFSFGLLPLVRVNPVLRETNAWWDQMATAGRAPGFLERDAGLGTVADEIDRVKAEMEGGTSSQYALRSMGFLLMSDLRRAFRHQTMAEEQRDMIVDCLRAAEAFDGTATLTAKGVDDWAQGVAADRFSEGPMVCRLRGARIRFYCGGPAPLPDVIFMGTRVRDEPMWWWCSVRVE